MKINLLILENKPIIEQLKIEESLLRTGNENWMILNVGSPDSIVMGLSSQVEDWIDVAKAKEKNIPIIQRFSGGGTVYVDQNTLFASFIINKDAVDIEPFPAPILDWTAKFYQKSLNIENFALKENDYAIGNKKIGGNAQYLTRNRWLHHTTFLHNYTQENMELLLHPKRQPIYRQERAHSEFLTTLAPYLTKKEFITRITQELRNQFEVTTKGLPTSFPPHRSSIAVH